MLHILFPDYVNTYKFILLFLLQILLIDQFFVKTLLLWLALSYLGFEHPTFCMWGRHFTRCDNYSIITFTQSLGDITWNYCTGLTGHILIEIHVKHVRGHLGWLPKSTNVVTPRTKMIPSIGDKTKLIKYNYIII